MSQSGTNRLINSVITGKKGGQSTLTSALMNANNEAKKEDKKKKK